MSKLINQVTININRLGAIRNSVCHLNQFMVLSGESGVGKSYLAAACNYIFHLLSTNSRLNSIVGNHLPSFNSVRKNWGQEGVAFTLKIEDLESYLKQDIVDYLRYIFNSQSLDADISISLPIKNDLVFYYSRAAESIEGIQDNYIHLSINRVLRYRVKDEDEGIIGDNSFAILLRFFLIKQLFGDFRAFYRNFILPPSRGAVLTESILPKSGLYIEFMNAMRDLDISIPEETSPSSKLLSSLSSVLGGSVSKDSLSDLYNYTTKDDIAMPLSAAASSVRELSPLFLIINKFNISNSSFFIEEPEAHLHPSKQRMMADVLSLMIENGAFVQITTHSDYLMRRLNELISAYNIRKERPDSFSEVLDRISGGIALNSSFVNALLLVKNSHGDVEVIEQSILNGFDFSSFITALTEGMDNEKLLNEMQETISDDRG